MGNIYLSKLMKIIAKMSHKMADLGVLFRGLYLRFAVLFSPLPTDREWNYKKCSLCYFIAVTRKNFVIPEIGSLQFV